MQEQYFNGIRFTIGPGRKYFSNGNVKPKSMHRYVWSYYNGEIPKGYEVHHKDLNRYNNDISNLELLEKHEHKKLHARILTDEQREWRRNNINEKARPKAIEWHKSEAGKQWHKKHGKTLQQKQIEVKCICEQCGKEFITVNNKGVTKRFCSGACAQKYRRDNGLNNIESICEVCGKKFLTDKYSPKRTCGKICGNKIALQTKSKKPKKERVKKYNRKYATDEERRQARSNKLKGNTYGANRNITEEYRKLASDSQPNRVVIEQYDLKGNFIAEYSSIQKAHLATGIWNIASASVKNGKSGGYIWKRKGN